MIKSVCKKAVFTAVALLAVFGLTTCSTLSSIVKNPVFSLHSMEITKITFTGTELLCKVNVENPNGIEIPFPEIDWEFFINSNSFISGTIKNNQNIKARATTVVDVPISLKYLEIFNTFVSLMNSKQADYKIALAAKFNLPVLGEKILPLEHEGSFPVLHTPSISFKGISLKNLSLTRIDFELSWEVENKNSFAMLMKDLSFNFAVNNATWASGKVPSAPKIEADKKTVIPLTFSINSLSMIKDITEIVTRGTSIAYNCGGGINLGMDFPGLDDFQAPFNFSGNTKLSR